LFHGMVDPKVEDEAVRHEMKNGTTACVDRAEIGHEKRVRGQLGDAIQCFSLGSPIQAGDELDRG